LLAAYALDALLGDPQWYPHPVRVMGMAIEFLETRLRRGLDESGELRAGFVLAGSLAIGSYALAKLAMLLPGGGLTETLLLYTSLARKDLERSALRVAEALERDETAVARERLRALAGRDPDGLDKNGISRAAVESVAENFVDGILVPLMWGAVAGAPGAMSFKAISTLDSMVGHRDERHIRIGRCSARMDDAAVFAWARLSIPLIAAAAACLGLNGVEALAIARRDGAKHESPNSGLPEAAFAGALGLKLGGAATYGGRRRELPEIGNGKREAGPEDIRRAVRLMNVSSLLALACALLFSRSEGG
jgi:adenosylcobinamide-phosphate synthase